jgi:hypothetical protein
MRPHFVTSITYFLQEGRDNLPECLKIVFQAARQQSIEKIVIFTARGEGVQMALENFCSLEEYRKIQLVAVTFPQGKEFTAEGKPLEVRISDETKKLLVSHNVPIIKAHLPFDPIAPLFSDRGVLAQDLSLVESALNIFGGGMSLCVQAVVLACDAGAVELGEHVIAMTSDTAILVQAATTRRMLRELVVREILCKPAILSIGRKESQIEGRISAKMIEGEIDQKPILGEGKTDETT